MPEDTNQQIEALCNRLIGLNDRDAIRRALLNLVPIPSSSIEDTMLSIYNASVDNILKKYSLRFIVEGYDTEAGHHHYSPVGIGRVRQPEDPRFSGRYVVDIGEKHDAEILGITPGQATPMHDSRLARIVDVEALADLAPQRLELKRDLDRHFKLAEAILDICETAAQVETKTEKKENLTTIDELDTFRFIERTKFDWYSFRNRMNDIKRSPTNIYQAVMNISSFLERRGSTLYTSAELRDGSSSIYSRTCYRTPPEQDIRR